jgi:hypothetical protein
MLLQQGSHILSIYRQVHRYRSIVAGLKSIDREKCRCSSAMVFLQAALARAFVPHIQLITLKKTLGLSEGLFSLKLISNVSF